MDADGSEAAVLNSNAFLIPTNTQQSTLSLSCFPNLGVQSRYWKDNVSAPKGLGTKHLV